MMDGDVGSDHDVSGNKRQNVLVLAGIELTFFPVISMEMFGLMVTIRLVIQRCFCYC